nr:MAG TPA: hypothetical protein [Caudoviricetes sp.]
MCCHNSKNFLNIILINHLLFIVTKIVIFL